MDFIDVFAPPEQEGTRAVLRAWLKSIGETVAVDDPLVELETDKVAMEVPSPVAGVIAEHIVAPGTDVPPGTLLARIRVGETIAGPAAAAPVTTGTASMSVTEALPGADPAAETRLSPAVRRAVRQHGLDPRMIAGSGRGGRLTLADVDAHLAAPHRSAAAHMAATAPSPIAAATGAPSTPSPGMPRSRSVPHDAMRRRIAENMARSVAVAPHVTAVFEADFSAIIAHRAANKAAYARDGIALTYTAYLVSAAARAMRAAPQVNSRWHDDRLEIFEDANIGVGTALDGGGLIVPVIHRAQDLSLNGIARRLADVTARAREGKLAPADVAHATFTISNHGVSGSLVATPIIIVQPQSAILGVGKLEKRVVVRDVGGADAIQIKPMAYVSLTIDHRALDGQQTNAWLTRFVEVLEGWPAS